MLKTDFLTISKICEFLLVILPIGLLFSNFLSEAIILIFIIIVLLNIDIKKIKQSLDDKVIYLLLFISLYLIINFFLNFDKNPSVSRSFLFIRFPLYAFTIFLSIEFLGVKLKNIFFFWLIILLIICLDLFYQYFNGENILGYKSIKQGDFNRLGGFLDDELKISNLIIYFFVPVFSFFHFYVVKNSFKNNFFLFLFFLLIYSTIFLTGERANFITFNIFIFIYVIFFKLNKIFFSLLFITIPIFYFSSNIFDSNLTKRMTVKTYTVYKNVFTNRSDNGFFYKGNQYFAHYSTALEITKDYPFFGVGLKNFRKFCGDQKYINKVHPHMVLRNCSTHPHNFYFEIMSETGFLGLLIFFISFTKIIYMLFKKSLKNHEYFLFGNTLIIFTFFVPFLPRGSFFTNWNAMIFWTVFGFCYYSYRKIKNSRIIF